MHVRKPTPAIFLIALAILAVAGGIAANSSKESKNRQILSLISDYKTWKQVNRLDDDVTAASFKIENSLSIGGS